LTDQSSEEPVNNGGGKRLTGSVKFTLFYQKLSVKSITPKNEAMIVVEKGTQSKVAIAI
jgi:hypothetical protein